MARIQGVAIGTVKTELQSVRPKVPVATRDELGEWTEQALR